MYVPQHPSDLPEFKRALHEYVVQQAGEVSTQLLGLGASSGAELSQYANSVLWAQREIDNAVLYWIAPDMVQLLQLVAPKMPAQPLLQTDMPSEAGLVYFSNPIIGTDANDPDNDIPVRCMVWGQAHIQTQIPGAYEGDAMSMCSFSDYRDFEEKLEAILGPTDKRRPAGDLLPLGRADWPYGHETDELPYPDCTDTTAKSICEDRRWMMALWTLSAQTSLTETVDVIPPRGVRRRLERVGVTEIPTTRVVQLRRRIEKRKPEGTREVEWSHRWLVGATDGGFWRNQWLPSTQAHRLQWIMPYVKGPDDKPLVVKDEVKAWVRQ